MKGQLTGHMSVGVTVKIASNVKLSVKLNLHAAGLPTPDNMVNLTRG